MRAGCSSKERREGRGVQGTVHGGLANEGRDRGGRAPRWEAGGSEPEDRRGEEGSRWSVGGIGIGHPDYGLQVQISVLRCVLVCCLSLYQRG